MYVKAFKRHERNCGLDELDIKHIQQGDIQAFDRLYDRMAEPALRYAAAIVGNDGLAADAVQDTFIRIYRNINRFDPSKPFEPWFYRILINECRRALRWRRRLLPTGTLPEEAAPQDDYQALYEAIGELELSLREPLVLRYLMGYQDQEAAQILGLSLTTMKGRVRRARHKLRGFLEKGDAI